MLKSENDSSKDTIICCDGTGNKVTVNENSKTSWHSFAFAEFLTELMALIKVSFHVIKSARINPMESLKGEYESIV
ncbi:hypothetical protein [Algoriphagus marincola]|uniref:hypothetical protein n=1 Tax=Algoriphagus marincola TaxID=264027 RepID=UPI00041BB0A4|nr:hypothetical protein [Algoriphagus marincola]